MRKPPEKYVPTLKGNKYAVALTQIIKSLKKSKHGVAMAQMSVKLMSKGEHRKADIVGKVMAQLSMKAAIKKWGEKAQFAISKEMKQLHWRNSYVPKHYHTLTKKQKDQLLESHIFVEEKRDGTIKARKVIGGNKQRDYITKQDVSSPTVTAEAVMLTCVIDAQENRDVAVVDIPNAFVQTVVSDDDAEHRVMVRIRGPLVDILVSMAPDVYGPYVSVTKTGQKVLIVECLNAVYGTMVAALLYYKKFVKSLKSKAFKLNPYDGCVANKIVKGKQITICFHVDDCKILIKIRMSLWKELDEGEVKNTMMKYISDLLAKGEHLDSELEGMIAEGRNSNPIVNHLLFNAASSMGYKIDAPGDEVMGGKTSGEVLADYESS